MAKSSDEKILRVGVIQRGKIVEERLLRRGQDVTIGSVTKNTFVVAGTGIPKSLRVFSCSRNGEYTLEFADDSEGRVSLDSKVHRLASLVEEGKTKKRGSSNTLSLDPRSRGKVVVGDVTLLFQFVTPPGQVSRPQLPASVKQGFFSQLDMVLAGLLLLSLVLQGGFAGGLHFWWETTGKYQVLERKSSARMLAPLIVEVEQKQEAEPENTKEEKEDDKEEVAKEAPKPAPEPIKPKAKKEPKKVAKTEARKPKEAKKASFERKREKVIDATILKFVTSKGDGTAGLDDALKDGATAKAIEDAWKTTGVRVAQAGEDAMFRGGPKKQDGAGNTYRKLDKKDVKGPKAGRVKTGGKKETKVKASIGLKKGSIVGGTGKMNKSSVAGVIKKRKSAIRKCYEKALRTNPKTKGKVIVKFTVGTAGRVTSSKVASNTTGDTGVGKCIASRIKGWRFPKPEKGSVTFSYPFVLSKAN